MNELLHRDPASSMPPPPPELTLATPHDASDANAHRANDVQRLQREAVSRRPELAAIRDRARAEQARAEGAKREAYPDVTVSTSYNSMWDMPEHRWMVGLGFNLPLWSGPVAEEPTKPLRDAHSSRATRRDSKRRRAPRCTCRHAGSRVGARASSL